MVVCLVDEMVCVILSNMYIIKFVCMGDKFIIEGKVESLNMVVEFLRNFEVLVWYCNVFMNFFLVVEEKKDKVLSFIVLCVEEIYGIFVVMVDLDEIV